MTLRVWGASQVKKMILAYFEANFVFFHFLFTEMKIFRIFRVEVEGREND